MPQMGWIEQMEARAGERPGDAAKQRGEEAKQRRKAANRRQKEQVGDKSPTPVCTCPTNPSVQRFPTLINKQGEAARLLIKNKNIGLLRVLLPSYINRWLVDYLSLRRFTICIRILVLYAVSTSKTQKQVTLVSSGTGWLHTLAARKAERMDNSNSNWGMCKTGVRERGSF